MEQRVEDGAERVDVALDTGDIVGQYLGSGVEGCRGADGGRGDTGVEHPCDAEVGHQHPLVVGAKQIPGFEVAVEHTAAMGEVDRVGRDQDVGNRPSEREGTLPEFVGQAATGHQWHEQEGFACGRDSAAVHVDDVRVLPEALGRPLLAFETAADLGTLNPAQNLDGHIDTVGGARPVDECASARGDQLCVAYAADSEVCHCRHHLGRWTASGCRGNRG